MNPGLAETVLDATGARRILDATVIQSLWSGYGEIVRLRLAGGLHKSVVLKHITAPEAGNHPRGWNTGLSHQRKIRSYQVEAHWYRGYAYLCAEAGCHVPLCLAVSASESETVLVLTDLDAEGFHLRRDSADLEDMRACLNWLARMHATFLGREATGLWESGSYWHLDTRPDELAALEDANLRDAAPLIDRALRQCRYQTVIHGDAKLANFCFSDDTPRPGVAAVDFQYVGGGCGMKDVAYFIGSCLQDDECRKWAGRLLDDYFVLLCEFVSAWQPEVSIDELETEWRALFDVAWADFHRFLKGWSPGHWKLNSFSEETTRRVVERLLG